eukprot:2823767-Ditylum_brightwellii.AAC.1
MDKETLDQQIQDASTQDRTVGYNVQPPEEINIDGANQDDDYEDSLGIVSDLLLSREPFENIEVGQFHNKNT